MDGMNHLQAQSIRKQLIDSLRQLQHYDPTYAAMLADELDAYYACYDEELPE